MLRILLLGSRTREVLLALVMLAYTLSGLASADTLERLSFLQNQGREALHAGRLDEALDAFEQGLEISEQAEIDEATSVFAYHLGSIHDQLALTEGVRDDLAFSTDAKRNIAATERALGYYRIAREAFRALGTAESKSRSLRGGVGAWPASA